MTLIQLEYFCEVYKCHNFSKAADAMNISQPSISIAISNLETERAAVPPFEAADTPHRGGRYALRHGNILIAYGV